MQARDATPANVGMLCILADVVAPVPAAFAFFVRGRRDRNRQLRLRAGMYTHTGDDENIG